MDLAVYLGFKYVPLQLTLLPLREMFGHPNSQVLAATAAKYGFHTNNYLHVCFNC
jgi:hypothetical protein